MEIYLSRCVIDNTKLNDEAISVYIALRKLINNNLKKYYINVQMISYLMYNRVPTRNEMDSIKLGIKSLIDNNIIKETEQTKDYKSPNEWILDLSGMYSNKTIDKHFAIVNSNEITKIYNILNRTDKFKLVRLYVSIIANFNHSSKIGEKYRNKICELPFIFFEESCKLSSSSIGIYIKLLEENKLLYVYRYKGFLVTCNKYKIDEKIINALIKRYPNCYSLYSDRNLCEEYCILKETEIGFENVMNKSTIEERKRMLMKYNALIKGTKYNDKDIKELYEYIQQYNFYQQLLADKAEALGKDKEQYISKIRPLNVFEELGYKN